MRLVLLMCSLLVLYQRANGGQVDSTRTTPLSPEEKLADILISLPDDVQELSTYVASVEEFEKQMRETTMEIKGVSKATRDEYREFLENVFNLKKNVKYSCTLFIATARDVIARIGYIERFINKIPDNSAKKLGRLLNLISKKFNSMADKSLKSLEELRGMLEKAQVNLLSIKKSSTLMRRTLKQLYEDGHPVDLDEKEPIISLLPAAEMVYAPVYLLTDRYQKREIIKPQLLSFKDATGKSQIGYQIIEEMLQSLEQKEQQMKESIQELTNSNNNNQWNLVLVKLQQARKVLDDFLKYPEKENGSQQENTNGRKSDVQEMENAVIDDNELATNVRYEEGHTNTDDESNLDLEVDYYD